VVTDRIELLEDEPDVSRDFLSQNPKIAGRLIWFRKQLLIEWRWRLSLHATVNKIGGSGIGLATAISCKIVCRREREFGEENQVRW
jgi:hypothetical protein